MAIQAHSSRTVTATVPVDNAPSSRIISMRSVLDAKFVEDAMLDLDDIFKKYQGWNDPVSGRLHKVRDDINLQLQQILESNGPIEGRIRQTVRRGFSELN